MSEFSQERDNAFIEFVKTGKKDKLLKYCKKYNVPIPDSELVLAVGIYKAVRYCTDIPQDIKDLTYEKCEMLGFKPYIEEVEQMEREIKKNER